jgi:hypothetical protein
MELNLNMRSIFAHPVTKPALAGVVSLGAGLVIGFMFGRHVEREIEAERRRERGSKVLKRAAGVSFDPEEVKEFIAQQKVIIEEVRADGENPIIVSSVGFDGQPQVVVEDENAVQRVIFAGSDDEWDMEKEQSERTEDKPYILHKDEFYENEKDYSQLSLTYFEGDDIMCDEEQTPVYNYLNVTGPLLFGHGSHDRNTFYVRNDDRSCEYEIIRDSGHFAIEVLALDAEDLADKEIRHSQHHVPKFRMD